MCAWFASKSGLLKLFPLKTLVHYTLVTCQEMCYVGMVQVSTHKSGSAQFKVEGLKRKVNVSQLYRNLIHPALLDTYIVL